MFKRVLPLVVVLVAFSLVLSACGGSTPVTEAPVATEPPTEALVATEPPTEAPVATELPVTYALKITGLVDSEMGWSEEEVKAMTTLDVESTNSKGETQTYTGVLISDLLTLASPQAGATTIVFVADDGYTTEVPLADVMACTNCILSFRSNGGFSSVLPTFAKSAQVKGVVEIQVK
jgi:DMSO/TMAO reductase YedYZ molybdopterin-dependent catalytic subunit